MQERESHQLETEVPSDVDQLLVVLRNLTRHDPDPAIRERLARLSAQRLGRHPERGRWLPRMVPAAIGLVIACAVTGGILLHRQNHPSTVNRAAAASPAVPESARAVQPVPPADSGVSQHQRRIRRTRPSDVELSKVVIPLPYSDGAVATGTEVTVPVFLSQDELMSLGVPMSPAIHDRRYLAELLLGDDGLPRAISIPLPPGVLTEKR